MVSSPPPRPASWLRPAESPPAVRAAAPAPKLPAGPTIVPIREDRDIVAARKAGRDLARDLGFGTADQTRLATAISELARNVVQHGGADGECVVADASDAERLRIRVVVRDRGPGIADVELALQPGYSTARSLGAGLPGTRRLVQEFAIDSAPGRGTVVTIAIALPRSRARAAGR